MKTFKIVIIIFFVFLITGCDNYHELNDLGIVSAIGIDKEDDNYVVSLQIINTQKAESTNIPFSNFITFEGKGKSVEQAISNIDKESSRFLYFSHLNLLIISDEIAKEGVVDVFDFFVREPISRTEFYILLAKENKAKDILSTFTALNPNPSMKITESLKQTAVNSSNTMDLQFITLLQNLLKKGVNIVMPSVTIEGNVEEGKEEGNIENSTPKSKLVLSELGIFKDNKLLGYLTDDEAFAFNIVVNEFKQGNVSYQCDDKNFISLRIDKVKSDVKPIFKDNKFTVDLKIKGEFSIFENNCHMKAVKEVYEEIENKTNELIYKQINDLILMTKNKETDIFGFGNKFYLNDYKNFKSAEKNWNDIYKDMDIKISTDFNLIKKGVTESNIKEEIHEK